MTCDEFRQCRFEYGDGTLDAASAAAARAHLAGCRACRAAVEREHLLASALSDTAASLTLSPEAKRTMARAIRECSGGVRSPRARWFGSWSQAFGLAFSGAALAGAALLLAMHVRSTGRSGSVTGGMDTTIDVPTQVQTRIFLVRDGTVIDAVIKRTEVTHASFSHPQSK